MEWLEPGVNWHRKKIELIDSNFDRSMKIEIHWEMTEPAFNLAAQEICVVNLILSGLIFVVLFEEKWIKRYIRDPRNAMPLNWKLHLHNNWIDMCL